jgi:hypothetical protein
VQGRRPEPGEQGGIRAVDRDLDRSGHRPILAARADNGSAG